MGSSHNMTIWFTHISILVYWDNAHTYISSIQIIFIYDTTSPPLPTTTTHMIPVIAYTILSTDCLDDFHLSCDVPQTLCFAWILWARRTSVFFGTYNC